MFNFKDIYINNYYTIVSKKEANGNIKNPNKIIKDYYYGEKTPYKAETKMIEEVLYNLNTPAILITSNLENQLGTSNISLKEKNIPYIGLYSACASFVSDIITISTYLMTSKLKNGAVIISSHNLNAEKQFRFPIEYGAPKIKRSTQTATCAIGLNITHTPSNIKVINGTIGTVIDSYIKDTYNMGAVMARSAYKTLKDHLQNTNTTIKNYDLILTGDLGKVGTKILKELLQKDKIKLTNHIDAGSILYKDNETSGASGPACLPLILFYNIINNKKYKKILLLATGSLHSPEMVNQKETIPAITHALTIEVSKWQYYIHFYIVEQYA